MKRPETYPRVLSANLHCWKDCHPFAYRRVGWEATTTYASCAAAEGDLGREQGGSVSGDRAGGLDERAKAAGDFR
jgi:hypothetical protein